MKIYSECEIQATLYVDVEVSVTFFHKGIFVVKYKCYQSTQSHKNPDLTPQKLLKARVLKELIF